jgi:hypothetical protein
MGNEYKAKLDGRKRVGRTDIQKKVAPPAPPNPVLGFTTLGHTHKHTYEHVCIYLRTGTTTSPH